MAESLSPFEIELLAGIVGTVVLAAVIFLYHKKEK